MLIFGAIFTIKKAYFQIFLSKELNCLRICTVKQYFLGNIIIFHVEFFREDKPFRSIKHCCVVTIREWAKKQKPYILWNFELMLLQSYDRCNEKYLFPDQLQRLAGTINILITEFTPFYQSPKIPHWCFDNTLKFNLIWNIKLF